MGNFANKEVSDPKTVGKYSEQVGEFLPQVVPDLQGQIAGKVIAHIGKKVQNMGEKDNKQESEEDQPWH